MRLHLKITPKLSLVFVLFAAAILGGMGTLAYYSGRTALEAAITSDLVSTAIEKDAALNAWIKERQSTIAMLANLHHLQEIVSVLTGALPNSNAARAAHDHLVENLNTWVGEGRPFVDLLVIDAKSGEVIVFSNPNEEGKFKEDRAYFINGKKGPYTQNPYYDITLQASVMTAAAPIVSAGGRLLAVIAGHLKMSELNEIILRRTGLHKTDDSFLVNTSHLFITQPRFVSDPAVLRRGIHTEDIKRGLAGDSGVVSTDDYRGVPVISVYRWLPERQLGLIVKMDQSEAFAPVRALGRKIIFIGALVLILASAIAVGLARTITQPILSLQEGVVRFGHGDRDVRLPEARGDELGVLAKEFNTMAAVLSEKEAQLRQHTAQLEAANKELEAFSYSVSHDLRAPLRAIDGFSRVILEDYTDKLDEEGKRFLNIIHNNTQKMGQLIDDLLVFSRLGRQEVRLSDIDLERLAKSVFKELKLTVPERKVQFTIDTLPPSFGDRAMIRQVFANLLSNAIKFTRPKETALIEVEGRNEGNENIYCIRDNGVGFDMQYVNKLFGVFQRLHSTTEFEGTGVGLAIVQRIIHRHGGRVWAEGKVNEGATIFFTLPKLSAISSQPSANR